jgi:hypothetical protein
VADIAKAALRNRVLEHLGVLAAGETAATADQTFVDEQIDAAHDELRKFGYVPFATSAIPSWAQIPLRDWVAAAVGQSYGKPWTDAEVEGRKRIAEQRLARQVSGLKHNVRVKGHYF